jgi:acetyltransferase-like isoleucine patch superfamily enzyme
MGKFIFLLKNFIVDNFSIIRGNNNKFIINGIFYKVKKDIRGNDNEVKLGKNSTLKNSKIFIRGNNNQIIIESNVSINNIDLWIEDNNNRIYIGDYTTIESGHFAVTENNKSIKIGQNCMFSTNVTIRTGDSHSIIDLESGTRINDAKDVIIGDSVWVGANAVLLKGVNIGNNSIVGTGSVVSGSFIPNVVLAGIPAKIVKNNVSWKRERI